MPPVGLFNAEALHMLAVLTKQSNLFKNSINGVAAMRNLIDYMIRQTSEQLVDDYQRQFVFRLVVVCLVAAGVLMAGIMVGIEAKQKLDRCLLVYSQMRQAEVDSNHIRLVKVRHHIQTQHANEEAMIDACSKRHGVSFGSLDEFVQASVDSKPHSKQKSKQLHARRKPTVKTDKKYASQVGLNLLSAVASLLVFGYASLMYVASRSVHRAVYKQAQYF